MYVSDNFVRADGALGSNWAAVIPNSNEFRPNTSVAGGLLINNNGFGPINASGGDCLALWAGQTFGNDQWASAQIKTVAPYTAVLNISAAVQVGGNTTYTYTVSSGDAATPISGGALYVIISGMADSGNNGFFVATTFGVGTFTVANASGVTRAGQSGTGNCPSDSGAGVMVRGSGTTATTINGYYFHVGTNSFGGDSRVSYYELWKVVNGVGTILAGPGGISGPGNKRALPNVSDILTLTAVGTTVTAYLNNVALYTITDSDVTSGVPGVTSFSINGPTEYVFADWSTPGQTFTGNNGTTFNNFQAGDFTETDAQLSSDSFKEGTALTQVASDNFQRADGSLGSNWLSAAGSGQIASHLAEPGTGGAVRNHVYWSGHGDTFNSDQYSEVTVATCTGTAFVGPTVRSSGAGVKGTTAETGYILLVPKTGTSGSLIVQRIVNGAGTTSILTVAGVTPQVGDVFKISAVGTTVTVYQSGVSKGSVSDSTIAHGFPGMFLFANTGNPVTVAQASLWAGGGVGVPSNFTVLGNQNFASDPTLGAYCDVLDNSTNASGYAAIYENSASWTADQYSQATMTGAALGSSICGPAVRLSATQDSGYWLDAQSGNILNLVKIANGVVTSLIQSAYTFNSGDVLKISVQGSTLIGRVNGAVAMLAVDTALASGKPGIIDFNAISSISGTTSGTLSTWSAGQIGTFEISGNVGVAGATVTLSGAASASTTSDSSGNYSFSGLVNGNYTVTPTKTGTVFTPLNIGLTLSNANIPNTNFTTGANVYSVPDCRTAPFGPNSSRTVNQTKIYDVQTSDNAAVPGKDSRSAVPADSRVSPNIPQNSRAPGTFGPGE